MSKTGTLLTLGKNLTDALYAVKRFFLARLMTSYDCIKLGQGLTLQVLQCVFGRDKTVRMRLSLDLVSRRFR